MRTLLIVFCAVFALSFSLEAKKKVKPPKSQQTQMAKQRKAEAKRLMKARKAPKHRQSVN